MKFRTWLLAVCMVVVPALAMFSHHIPSGVRRSLRDGALRWVGRSGSVVAAKAPAAQPPEPARPAASHEAAPIPLDQIAGRLAQLGAVAVQCVPLPGEAGRHLASCQVPIDPDAQLHRVFQAEGIGAEAAANALFEHVASWRQQRDDRVERGAVNAAARLGSGAGPGAGSGPGSGRF